MNLVKKPKQRAWNISHNKKSMAVFTRDNWICHLCGGHVSPSLLGTTNEEAPTVDHLIPRSVGGTRRLSNLKLAHRRCNRKRADSLSDINHEECPRCTVLRIAGSECSACGWK